MNDQTKIHSTNIEDTSLANIEAKAQVYLSAETEFITAKGSNIHDIAANLNNTLSRHSSVAQTRNQTQSTNNYIANTTANNSATTITTYILKENISTLLLLSPEQIKTLEGYAVNNDLAGLRAYLEKIKKELQEQLKSAGSTMATKIKNAIGGINQLLGASDAVIISTLFDTQTITQPPAPPPAEPSPPITPPTPPPPTTPPVPPPPTTPPTPPADPPSTTIQYILSQAMVDLLFLTAEQKKKLEELANSHDLSGLRTYLEEIKKDLQGQLSGAGKTIAVKLRNAIGVIDQLLGTTDNILLEKLLLLHQKFPQKYPQRSLHRQKLHHWNQLNHHQYMILASLLMPK
jgi:hypothetical protein